MRAFIASLLLAVCIGEALAPVTAMSSRARIENNFLFILVFVFRD